MNLDLPCILYPWKIYICVEITKKRFSSFKFFIFVAIPITLDPISNSYFILKFSLFCFHVTVTSLDERTGCLKCGVSWLVYAKSNFSLYDKKWFFHLKSNDFNKLIVCRLNPLFFQAVVQWIWEFLIISMNTREWSANYITFVFSVNLFGRHPCLFYLYVYCLANDSLWKLLYFQLDLVIYSYYHCPRNIFSYYSF